MEKKYNLYKKYRASIIDPSCTKYVIVAPSVIVIVLIPILGVQVFREKIGIIESIYCCIIVFIVLFLSFLLVSILIGMKNYFSTEIILTDNKIVVNRYFNRTFFPLLKTASEEINFIDVSYIYYAGDEVDFLAKLRTKFEKYNLDKNEMDYTESNLVNRYKI